MTSLLTGPLNPNTNKQMNIFNIVENLSSDKSVRTE